MSQDGHKPNAASWFMWGVGGVTELIVYAALVQDRAKEVLPAVCAVAVVLTFWRVWRKEGFGKLERQDWWTIGLDVAVVVVWFATKNPILSNVLLGVDMIASFAPVLSSTWRDPRSEHPKPWRTWTCAYSLLTLVVILQWESGWELIYPVLYAVLHGAIWRLSSIKRS